MSIKWKSLKYSFVQSAYASWCTRESMIKVSYIIYDRLTYWIINGRIFICCKTPEKRSHLRQTKSSPIEQKAATRFMFDKNTCLRQTGQFIPVNQFVWNFQNVMMHCPRYEKFTSLLEWNLVSIVIPQNKWPQLVSTLKIDESVKQIGHVSCRDRPTKRWSSRLSLLFSFRWACSLSTFTSCWLSGWIVVLRSSLQRNMIILRKHLVKLK